MLNRNRDEAQRTLTTNTSARRAQTREMERSRPGLRLDELQQASRAVDIEDFYANVPCTD